MEEQILKKHQLKKTAIRKHLLDLFLNTNTALSHAMIEKQVEQLYDRVTLYRTLNTFEEKGIIHKIMNFEGVAMYALCVENCEEHHHHDNHIHFSCEKCKETICVSEEYTPKIILPKEYQIHEIMISVKGICPKCQ
jgi:Fur family transcriptional regulator, ferric uptake regulator